MTINTNTYLLIFVLFTGISCLSYLLRNHQIFLAQTDDRWAWHHTSSQQLLPAISKNTGRQHDCQSYHVIFWCRCRLDYHFLKGNSADFPHQSLFPGWWKKSYKPFVAPEGAVWHLINCLLGLNTTSVGVWS